MKILINFIITIILLSLIIWNRLIRKRTSVDIYTLIINPNALIYIIISVFIIIQLVTIILSLKVILQRFNLIKETTFLNFYWISKYNQYLMNFINIPRNLYDTLSDKYDLFTNIIINIGSYIAANFNYPYILLGVFLYLPRIIVLIAFLLDIFIWFKFHYFYIYLPLLLIPLVFKVFTYMVFYQSMLMYMYCELFLDLKEVNGFVEIKLKKIPVRGKSIEWMKENRHKLITDWYIGTKLNNIVYHGYEKELKIKPYINIIISTLYFIGWIYIFKIAFI